MTKSNLLISALTSILIILFIYISDTCTAFQCKNIGLPVAAISTIWLALIFSVVDLLIKQRAKSNLTKYLISLIIILVSNANIVHLKFLYTASPSLCPVYKYLIAILSAHLLFSAAVFYLINKYVNLSTKFSKLAFIALIALILIEEGVLNLPHPDIRKFNSTVDDIVLWKMRSFNRDASAKTSYDNGKCRMNLALKDADLKRLANAKIDPRKKLPNIVIIMSDALRSSQNDPQIMPFLNSQPGIHAVNHYSSSNCTRFALFTILTGLEPIFYRQYKNEHIESDLISFLRQLDYKINFILGKTFDNGRDLLDLNNDVSGYNVVVWKDNPYDNEWALKTTFDKIAASTSAGRPHLFFVPTYGTHKDYFYPKSHEKFLPVVELGEFSINTLKTIGTENKDLVRKIKNRYNNSSYYFDSLVQEFVTKLKAQNLYDDLILIVLGDHGEEFGESGINHWEHGVLLNDYQLKSFLYMKFPAQPEQKIEIKNATFHADIFMTVLSYLNTEYGLNLQGLNNYKGESMLGGIDPNRVNYAYTCGNESPSMFCKIENGKILETKAKFDRKEIEFNSD